MPLAIQITAEQFAALPDDQQAFYKPRADGKDGYELEVTGIDGLRNSLGAVRGERDGFKRELRELRERLGDLDLEAAKAALERVAQLDDKALLDEGKIDELLTKRTEKLVADQKREVKRLTDLLDAATKDNGSLTRKLSEVLIDSGATAAAVKAGVRAGAVPDVLLRARRVWRLQDGNPMPFRDGGDEVLYGANARDPITMDEWVAGLQADAPHLFERNEGAGAEGGRQGAGNRIVLTREQARDVATFREAEQQAARAGATLVIREN